MTAPIRLPEAVTAFAARGPDWAAYVDRLPRLVAELAGDWDLTLDGPPQHGHVSLVLPVRRDGVAAMLKLAFSDDEGEHEALALRTWGGRGAVRLLAADPRRSALLVQRLDPVDLHAVPVLEACEVVAGLYRRLHVAAPPQLRLLTTYVERWNDGLATLPRDAPVPHRLVQQALARGRELAVDPASNGVLIHADLHFQNVLKNVLQDGGHDGGQDGVAPREEAAADARGPWLAIDPKPVSGDPHYELAPMLHNRWDEAVASGDVRFAVRRRFHTLVDESGLDEDRSRNWVVVRMMHKALWELQDASRERRVPDPGYLTMCVAVAKAVQD